MTREGDTTVEQRISLVTLGVDDLARARAFYEALGWSGAQQPDDEVCFFQAGGMVFGLWTALGGHGAQGLNSRTTFARPTTSLPFWPKPSGPEARSSARQVGPTGAVPRAHSQTPTVTYGR